MRSTFLTLLGASALAACLAGCGIMQDDAAQARADTRKAALMTNALASSAASLQKQRDAIATAAQIERNALENRALRFETELTATAGSWRVAGQADRLNMFDAVRSEADKLSLATEQQQARAREQAAALAKVRSAVAFQSEKLHEAALGLITLAEPPSREDEAKFLFNFGKKIRDDIKTDSEAAAAQAQERATTPAKGATP